MLFKKTLSSKKEKSFSQKKHIFLLFEVEFDSRYPGRIQATVRSRSTTARNEA